MEITKFNQLGIPAQWFQPLCDTLSLFGIDTTLRQAAFIAQCYHESNGFKDLEENLNYSANALLILWPGHFNSNLAQIYARHPEMIANRAYASRMGNGNEASGDGWKYRGRGVIQITGKDNYVQCSAATGVPLLTNPDIAAQCPGALNTAGWFWEKNKLNSLADVRDWSSLTKRINGGTTGLADRIALTGKFITILT